MSFKNLIFGIFLIGALSSCSIQVNIDHNADDSGKVGIQMKTENQELFEKFKGQLPENDYLSGLNLLDSMPDMKNSLLPSLAAELFGFKNPTITELENGGKEVSLEYKDISKLNGSNEKRDKSKLFFKKRKNSLSVYLPKSLGDFGQDEKTSNPMMGLISNMIQAELNFKFERKIKRSNYKKIAFSDDQKQAKIRFSVDDFEELAGKKITFWFE